MTAADSKTTGLSHFAVFQILPFFRVRLVAVNFSDTNQCEPNPCINGQCQNKLRKYVCVCNSGFQGMNCSEGNYIKLRIIGAGVSLYKILLLINGH